MSPSFNIIFAGTPAFAVKTLDALVQSRHKVTAVYTQPDRPAGRGRKMMPSPVKQFAVDHELPVYQPVTLRDSEEQTKLAELQVDLMVVVAYGLILPVPVLQAPKLGCLNVHASILPRWRGAAPIQRAILAGDAVTGVTIMQMDKGLDTGDMLYKVECPILFEDTTVELHDRLSLLGADALLHTLDHLATIVPTPQDHSQATYAAKITKEEARLDWALPAIDLQRKVRAFNPWPVAFFTYGNETLRVWQADVIPQEKLSAQPGTLLHVSPQGLEVATGKDILRLQKIQFPGGRVLSVSEALNARHNQFVLGSLLE